MIAWWMAQLALLGTLLALAAFGAESALQVARRQTRWVWALAMALTIALGALAPIRLATTAAESRSWDPTDVSVTTGIATTRTASLMNTVQAGWHDGMAYIAEHVRGAWSIWHGAMPAGIERALLIVWAIASLLVFAAFVAVHIRYQRRRLHWPLGDVHGTTVRIATDTGPAVIGVTSAEIVLPHWLLARDDDEQRLVLEHELEHVRQHDPLLLALAQAAVVILPWHPAVWWMASRLRLATELDCDRRVLQRGASARDYGTLLIDLTDHRTGFGAALPAFSCTPSNLERRLVAMTPKRLKHPVVRVVATGAFASLAMLAACEAKLPTADEMDRMTASTATAAAGRVTMIDTGKVSYFVDGRAVTREEADKLAAEEIASVNVSQKGMQSGGEVRIMTRLATVRDTAPTRIMYKRTDPTRAAAGDTMTSLAPPPAGATKSRTGFTGLMIVDGVITDPVIVNSMLPDQILTVNVIKGAAATSQYTDPRAANGVIQIVTKKGARR